jgi:mono/diheme cytochrome c family protein
MKIKRSLILILLSITQLASAAADDRNAGQAIYQQLCVSCHGANGNAADTAT